jgi:hypothetical protein
MDEDIKIFSDYIEIEASQKANCYPIDRYFLNPFVSDILQFDRNDFLLYNFEKVNNNFTIHLMLCLPELWTDITLDEILGIASKFSNSFSFYGLINFTYKYIEFDILREILDLPAIKSEFKIAIKQYLESQYPNFFKTESDFLFFEDGLWGVKIDDWLYVKQRLLIDKRVRPGLQSTYELKRYVEELVLSK